MYQKELVCANLIRTDLAFTYPLPRHLQYIPEEAANALEAYQLEQFMRMQIMVVHSANLQQFFDTIMRSADSFFR